MTAERGYRAVAAEHVDPEVRRVAVLAGELGCDLLGLRSVTLIWVLPDGNGSDRPGAARHVKPADWAGWVHDDEPARLYVRADMPAEVILTTLHELRHLAQLRDGLALDEDDAEHWARTVAATPYYLEGVTYP